MRFYNRNSAALYALSYGARPNRYFHNYGGDGGDCTNFVSQALWAGGWPMFLPNPYGPRWPHWAARQSEDAYETEEHWYNRFSSLAWVSASEFARLLRVSGRGWISDPLSMWIGDVVQIIDIVGRVDHTMMITSATAPSSRGGVVSANLWLTYHSRNTVNLPLAEVRSRLKPGEQLIFWKISDVIFSPGEQGLTAYGSSYPLA